MANTKKKNSRKIQKKSKRNVKKIGGSKTEQIETLSQLRKSYFNFAEADLFKKDFFSFLKLIYLKPSKIKRHNIDDIEALKRIASGLKTQKFLLNEQLLLPNDRIYEKNNQGFLYYTNNIQKPTIYYTFLKPSTYDIRHNLMKNRLYIVISKNNIKLDDFKTNVDKLKINSQWSDDIETNISKIIDRTNSFKNIVYINKTYGGFTVNIPKQFTSRPTINDNVTVASIKINNMKFEINEENEFKNKLSDFKDFQINIISSNQAGGSKTFFESPIIQPNKTPSQQFSDELQKENRKTNKIKYLSEDFKSPLTLYPVHKKIKDSKINKLKNLNGDKTYTELLHMNNKFFNRIKDDTQFLNIDKPELYKYYPEEKEKLKFELNNDGIQEDNVKKLNNNKIDEFSRKLNEL
jgi:hypothetical protein